MMAETSPNKVNTLDEWPKRPHEISTTVEQHRPGTMRAIWFGHTPVSASVSCRTVVANLVVFRTC